MRKRNPGLVGVLFIVVGVLFLFQCASSEEGSDKDQQLAADWAWLEEGQASLNEKRQQLTDLQQQLAEMPEVEEEAAADEEADEEAVEDAAEGEALPTREELAAQVEALEEEVGNLTDDFGQRLAMYINALQIPQGEALTPEQLAAIRMKSDEDILVAREWIQKGGDYRRAIDIYEGQLIWDPDNEKLQKEMEYAEQMRFVTPDRFAQVIEGLTREQVTQILGPVNLQNMKKYPDDQVEAWFYRREDGGVAAVWFRFDSKFEEYRIYKANFDEVPPKVIGPDGEDEKGEEEPTEG